MTAQQPPLWLQTFQRGCLPLQRKSRTLLLGTEPTVSSHCLCTALLHTARHLVGLPLCLATAQQLLLYRLDAVPHACAGDSSPCLQDFAQISKGDPLGLFHCKAHCPFSRHFLFFLSALLLPHRSPYLYYCLYIFCFPMVYSRLH